MSVKKEQEDIIKIEDSRFCGENRTIVYFTDGSRACSCGRILSKQNKISHLKVT